jgi:hypothetical protein
LSLVIFGRKPRAKLDWPPASGWPVQLPHAESPVEPWGMLRPGGLNSCKGAIFHPGGKIHQCTKTQPISARKHNPSGTKVVWVLYMPLKPVQGWKLRRPQQHASLSFRDFGSFGGSGAGRGACGVCRARGVPLPATGGALRACSKGGPPSGWVHVYLGWVHVYLARGTRVPSPRHTCTWPPRYSSTSGARR